MQSLLKKSILITATGFSATTVLADSLLEPVIVTANRHTESLSNTLASTTVITSEDIEKSTATTLDELLNAVQGLDVKPSGVFGKSTSIFMRGTNSSHILTLIDGVKLFSATSGGTAYQHIPLTQIDRIEIVRGPRSGLYGSEAIGGVIQIFTKKGQSTPEAHFSIEEGSFNTSELNAGMSGQTGSLRYSFQASQLDTDSFDAIIHTSANDKDGYYNKSLSTNLTYKISNTLSVDFTALDASGNTLYDNCLNTTTFATSDNCNADVEQQTFSTKLSITPDSIWDGALTIGSSKDLYDDYWEDAANGTFLTNHDNLNFQNNIQLSESNLLIVGIDSVKDTVDATAYADYDRTRDNDGIYIAYNTEIGKVKADISVRTDDNEQFGSHSTGSINIGSNITDNSKFFISAGTAFKAPSFNELYFPFYGNEALIPEESETLEINYQLSTKDSSFEVSLYETNVDNLINYDSSIFQANNISKAKIDGVEISFNIQINSWLINASTAYVDPINKDESYLDNLLPGRVKQKTSVKINRDFGDTNLSLNILNQGERYTDANNTNKLDGYTTLDIKVGHKLNKTTTVSAKLINALDEDYTVNEGFGGKYSTQGQSVFLSLSHKM